VNKLYLSFVRSVVARPRRAAILLATLCVPLLILSASFFADIRAGLEELLPKSAPSVKALQILHDRIGGQSTLTVIAHSDVPEDNRRFIKELTGRLEALHLPEIRSIQGSVDKERAWAKARAPLLVAKDRFDPLMDDVENAIKQGTTNALSLGLDDDDPSADSKDPKEKTAAFKDLEAKFDSELAKNDRFPNGMLETPDGKDVVVLMWLQGSDLDLDVAVKLQRAVKADVEAIRGKYPASLVVAYNGEVPNLIEEHDAILADLSLSSILVFALVGALIIAYFRSLRSVIAVTVALVPGLLATFALGKIVVGHLNSNTAFLGSIIVGNGINYPLLLLAYYRGQPREQDLVSAITEAARKALPGTLGAAVTASAAYGGLSASSLRGFSQFGLLGGVGMLTVWLFTFIAMPVAIAVLHPPRQNVEHSFAQGIFARLYAHRIFPRVLAAGFLCFAGGLAVYGAVRAYHTGLYEMDMRTLRNRESLAHGASSWDRTINRVFGVWLNPVAGLVEQPEQREATAQALRDVLLNAPPYAERVETIESLVPNDAEQAHRLVRLKEVLKDVKRVPPEELPEKVRPYIAAWSQPENLQPITLAEVPPSMKQGYFEKNGRADRTVLVFPSLAINFDDATKVLTFDDRLKQAPLPKGAVVGGAFLFMAEIIRLVRDEAPRVILVVCLLVAGVLLPIFWRRKWRIPVVVGTVAVVAVVSQAIMVALGVRINMLNFAAMPITIGVGADYVVNLLGAMDALDASPRQACVRMGPAIALCSLTTVVGYFSLVLASSGALRTFGWAAVLGELMAVTTVLLVVPALLPDRTPV
jgi:predicted RND superfamily exporter protein